MNQLHITGIKENNQSSLDLGHVYKGTILHSIIFYLTIWLFF